MNSQLDLLPPVEEELEKKAGTLTRILSKYQRPLVAFSGGVDSALLLKLTHLIHGDAMLGVIADSPTLPEREKSEALNFAREHRIPIKVLSVNELDIAEFRENPANRCYFCKTELYGVLSEYAASNGYGIVIDGTHLDELRGHRPGAKAVQEKKVATPYVEAGFGKSEIRKLSRALQLSVWDKPAMACLSSRFPTGEAITFKKLRKIEKAEDLLRDLGFRNFRVRYHEKGRLARIELSESDIMRAFVPETRETIQAQFRRLGFFFTAIDLEPRT